MSGEMDGGSEEGSEKRTRAVLGLVYTDEKGQLGHLWSQSMTFDLRGHDVRQVVGTWVVRAGGFVGKDCSGRVTLRLNLKDELRLEVEGLEGCKTILVKDAYFTLGSSGPMLWMVLPGDEVLRFEIGLDETGRKLRPELKILRGGRFCSVSFLNYIPELNYYYEDREFTLRGLLLVEYADGNGKRLSLLTTGWALALGLPKDLREKVAKKIIGDGKRIKIDLRTWGIPDGKTHLSIPFDKVVEELLQREILRKLLEDPEHVTLVLEAMGFFREISYQLLCVKKPLVEAQKPPDLLMEDLIGREVIVECKRGDEVDVEDDKRQAKGYFAHASLHNGKVIYYFGGDVTSQGAKELLKHVLKLHEEHPEVAFEVHVAKEFKSVEEVKAIVGG